MVEPDLLGSPLKQTKSPAVWLGALIRGELLQLLGDPFGYALERVVYCLALGIGFSILAAGVRFVVQVVVSSVS